MGSHCHFPCHFPCPRPGLTGAPAHGGDTKGSTWDAWLKADCCEGCALRGLSAANIAASVWPQCVSQALLQPAQGVLNKIAAKQPNPSPCQPIVPAESYHAENPGLVPKVVLSHRRRARRIPKGAKWVEPGGKRPV